MTVRRAMRAAPRRGTVGGMELCGVSKWALRDVDLVVRPGEIVAVRGRNGAGKSTLLRIAAGVSRPGAGRVTGRPHPVGYVPDRFTADQHMSALSFLTHLGRIRGLPAARDRAAQLLERFALVGGSGSALRMLSKGNTQKVALAQALLVPPRLLVLDEPWTGLDAPAQRVLHDVIAEVAHDGGAVLVTDHRAEVAGARQFHLGPC